jgi:hypothetical protein
VTRRLLIPIGVVAFVLLARAYLATEGSTPPGQPPLEQLTNTDQLRAHFNRNAERIRVLMLVAPSCSVCLKGARVIERILGEHETRPIDVFVVWQPMLATDWGRPSTGSLGRLSDARVRQFWDAERIVATALKASFPAREETLGCCVTDGVWWDLIAVFPAGARWHDRFPDPLLLEGTLEDAADRFTAALAGQPE